MDGWAGMCAGHERRAEGSTAGARAQMCTRVGRTVAVATRGRCGCDSTKVSLEEGRWRRVGRTARGFRSQLGQLIGVGVVGARSVQGVVFGRILIIILSQRRLGNSGEDVSCYNRAGRGQVVRGNPDCRHDVLRRLKRVWRGRNGILGRLAGCFLGDTASSGGSDEPAWPEMMEGRRRREKVKEKRMGMLLKCFADDAVEGSCGKVIQGLALV